ncbi:protein PHLOEM PROTEIN 2-LIKE A1-like [Curcuma longa]|uniref:protein PHLOEM PROTEIN 2-LIKE A1-like n=1 Tax=Curcuma longa TaxID=136217 RepID=UPI003D9DF576
MGLAPSQEPKKLPQEPKNNGQTTTEVPIEWVEHLEPITRSDSNKSKANVWKKHWVDDGSKIHCFALFARDLSITWGDDQRYWQWTVSKGAEDSEFETAVLKAVCWLDISGKFDTSNLTPKVKYEVVFAVMMSRDSYGWGIPVTLRIKFPDERIEQRKESLEDKPKGQWIELKVCEFVTPQKPNGEVEISLFEHGGHWKNGLIVKGVLIRPKK